MVAVNATRTGSDYDVGRPRSGLSFVLPPGLFRLILAVAVVLSHTSRFAVGRLAVLLFFYLSGYWTARIWREKFQSRETARFYAARYLRIAPLYLITMVIAAFARHLPIHFENLTLLGVATTHRDPLGVAWSLDIELQFYLLVPFLMLLAEVPALALLAGAVAVAAIGFVFEHYSGVDTAAKYLPAFILGLLTFVKAWKPSARSAAFSLVGFAAATAAVALTPFINIERPHPFDDDIFAFLWMLPLVPYVARSLTEKSTRLDRHLGNLSYPLYLVHFSMIAVVGHMVGGGLVSKAVAVGLGAIGALLIYVVIDRPVDRWRVRLTERGPGDGQRRSEAA